MKNELEIKMYNSNCQWADTNVFYGNSSIVTPIIMETREYISKVSERKASDNVGEIIAKTHELFMKSEGGKDGQ